MEYLSSDIIGHETKTLYVIGNGFDLFHGIPSSYSHFYHWLKAKGKNEFISKMESFFPSIINGELLLWKDFESALGIYDRNKIFNDATVKLDIKLDEETKYEKIDDNTWQDGSRFMMLVNNGQELMYVSRDYGSIVYTKTDHIE